MSEPRACLPAVPLTFGERREPESESSRHESKEERTGGRKEGRQGNLGSFVLSSSSVPCVGVSLCAVHALLVLVRVVMVMVSCVRALLNRREAA
ncbi:hypothetical protein ACJRO7_003488 [Eucalyptus globulus]|uniref:Transmembrane protein n=1 Tax=Eucalyptus globulus TaxID=34317 RepID=A0ABD3IW55_EUCGL